MFTVEIAKYAKVNMSKIIRGQQKDKTNVWFKHDSHKSKQRYKCVVVVVVVSAFMASHPPVHLKRPSEGLQSSEREQRRV